MEFCASDRRSSISVLVIGVAVSLCAGAALAVPIVVDGNIDGNDVYTLPLVDDVGEMNFGGDGWDIASVLFAWDDANMYIGLDTVGNFDPNGGDDAFPQDQETVFLFQSTDATPDSYFFILSTTGNPSETSLVLVGNGLDDEDWDAAFGTDLELRISLDVLADLDDEFSFMARLDNSATAPDDIVIGVGIPEPAALSLVAVGSLVLVARRKRKR